MKTMKKVLAMLIAVVMTLGMTVTAFADTNLPAATDKATATVENVEAGATVVAYQIVKGKYNTERGFLGYEVANSAISVADKTFRPTAEEVTAIARQINGGLALTSQTMTADASGNYVAELTAGYWVVLVKDTVSVYNPMLVGIYYDVKGSGDNNTLVDGTVDAEDDWELAAVDAYAKKSDVEISKKITSEDKVTDVVGDVAYGDTVSFEINTTVPDYSKEYTTAVFTIHDSMDAGLDLKADSVNVTVTGAKADPVKGTDYTITTTDHGFDVAFAAKWILENGAAAVKVKYSATVNSSATTNYVANKNEVYLTYTNNPGETEDTDKEITRHYTFEIDGFINGAESEVTEEIRKMGTEIINGTEVTKPLPGAKFAIRKAGETDVIAYATSTSDGLLNFKGLDADVAYEIYEVEAPKGWTINDTIYTAKITAEYDDEGILKSYSVEITNNKDNEKATSVHSTTDKGTTVIVNNATTDIPNTKLVDLPSTGGIGTTIFTIAGCAIMIAAAFLFIVSRRKESK